MAVVGASGAAYAQDTGDLETVVVTGYRASLEKALDLKRSAVDASDSILAEDIGKFPDMNVSESLQRIPGVAISRESGEGRQVTVRGLGAQFTRVRINGIEAMATVGSQDVSTSGGGTNRGRAFDFNVFASELFNKLTIHKSASASTEEGSLGATVDLTTARPFDHPGFLVSGSASAEYQDLAGSVTPRLAALVSNTFFDGKLGILVSGAFSASNTLEEGTSSVRWNNNTNTSATDATSSGYNWRRVCTDAGTTCSSTGATFSAASAAFRPRFPRYDIVPTKSKRLGLTSSIQFQPDDKTCSRLTPCMPISPRSATSTIWKPTRSARLALAQAATSSTPTPAPPPTIARSASTTSRSSTMMPPTSHRRLAAARPAMTRPPSTERKSPASVCATSTGWTISTPVSCR